MKKLLLILFILPSFLAFAQTEISLDECYLWARENYPNLKKSEINKEISGLKIENIKTNFLPKATLKGQATYQSEVTKIDIPLPNVEIPSMSKDQYKLYLEFQQNIWDGGITASQKLLEETALKSTLNELEIELYQLNDKINQAWFSALAVQKSESILNTQKEILDEKIKMIKSGIKNGVVESSTLDVLLAESLNIDQNILETEAGYLISLKVLSILTGKTINEQVILKPTSTQLIQKNILKRPELLLFESQSNQLDVRSDFLDKQRKPKFFGFGQGGIGRPGLNMLNNDFSPYYLVGVGLSWNALDWKKTNREKQIIELQKTMIQSQQETFEQNISMLLEQQLESINKFEKLIQSDLKMISLREKIAQSSASKLKNGTINSADYIADLNSETIAKLKLETHKIQLQEAITKYNTIKGTSKK